MRHSDISFLVALHGYPTSIYTSIDAELRLTLISGILGDDEAKSEGIRPSHGEQAKHTKQRD
jgi:hypothetical protein